MASYYRLRWTFRLLAVDLLVTMVATVYLGWHFFVDDLAGLAIGATSVLVGTRMVHPRGRPLAVQASPGVPDPQGVPA
jgi:membrane-associated phospholipid phosphatase